MFWSGTLKQIIKYVEFAIRDFKSPPLRPPPPRRKKDDPPKLHYVIAVRRMRKFKNRRHALRPKKSPSRLATRDSRF